MFFAGMLIAAMAGQELLSQRYPGSHWGAKLSLIFLFASLFIVVQPFPRFPRPGGSDAQEQDRGWREVEGTPQVDTSDFLMLGGFVVLYSLRWHWGGALALGITMALYFWWKGKTTYKRLWIAAVAGWFLAGFVALGLRWNNEQQFFLACVIGALATALQGFCEIWLFVKALLRARNA